MFELTSLSTFETTFAGKKRQVKCVPSPIEIPRGWPEGFMAIQNNIARVLIDGEVRNVLAIEDDLVPSKSIKPGDLINLVLA